MTVLILLAVAGVLVGVCIERRHENIGLTVLCSSLAVLVFVALGAWFA